jgi:hypothetical protein
MVDNRVIRTVKARSEELLGDGHADAAGKSLTQRTCCYFYTRGKKIFGVTGCPAFPLAKFPEIIQGEIISCEMKKAVEQHGAVPGREYKPVTGGPFGVERVVL